MQWKKLKMIKKLSKNLGSLTENKVRVVWNSKIKEELS